MSLNIVELFKETMIKEFPENFGPSYSKQEDVYDEQNYYDDLYRAISMFYGSFKSKLNLTETPRSNYILQVLINASDYYKEILSTDEGLELFNRLIGFFNNDD